LVSAPAGHVDSEGVHMLSTGGMVKYAEDHARDTDGTVIMATETGMLHPLRLAAPGLDWVPANAEASCKYMKMITLPKLRDCLRDLSGEVKVPAEIAERARIPIERMVAINA
jgi:quinolinate synthase